MADSYSGIKNDDSGAEITFEEIKKKNFPSLWKTLICTYILWAEWIPGRYIIIKNQRQRYFLFKKFFQIQAVVGISKFKSFLKHEVTHIYSGNVKNVYQNENNSFTAQCIVEKKNHY